MRIITMADRKRTTEVTIRLRPPAPGSRRSTTESPQFQIRADLHQNLFRPAQPSSQRASLYAHLFKKAGSCLSSVLASVALQEAPPTLWIITVSSAAQRTMTTT
jgi:hypothetical protein